MVKGESHQSTSAFPRESQRVSEDTSLHAPKIEAGTSPTNDWSSREKRKMASAFDGHASKRQRTDVEGHGVHVGNRDSFDDPHKPPPSAVVHVRSLADTVTETDLVEAVQHFGAVSYVMMMPKKRQALIEFEDLHGANSCVSYASSAPIYVGGSRALFNFSTSKKIQRPPGAQMGGGIENHILLFTILNPQYPITVEVMHTICSPSGSVLRIVIFKKNGVQAMVEFDSIDSAKRAKQSLNGADIYSGCCTLKIEYAKPTRLNVYRNDSESWDYENSQMGKEGPRSQPLLDAPRYGAGPQHYSQTGAEHPDPSNRRNGPQPYSGGYGGMDSYSGRGDGKYDQFGRPVQGQQQSYGGYGGYYQDSGYGGNDPYQSGPSGPPPYGPPHGYQDQGGMPGAGQQQGAVLMVYGLDPIKMNAKKIFNLFCLYGNVVRVKFLKTKEGSAMVQMGDQLSCDRAMQNLNNATLFEKKLQLGRSKQAFLQDVPNPHELPDGTPSFMDFMGNRNNRFANPEAAAKNRIQPPNKVLHFFNTPPQLSEEDIQKLFEECGAKQPPKVLKFPTKENARSITGLCQWETKSDAMEALVLANHYEVPNPVGKNPYVFKLCFSSQPIQD